MELTAGEITNKVQKRMNELEAWHNRMDSDYKLWNMDRKPFDDHKMAINITSNDPRTLADKLQARLAGAKRVISIKPPSRYTSEEMYNIIAVMTSLITYALERNDLRLRRMLQPSLIDSLCWFLINRGMAIVRVLTYEEDGEIVWDYTPFDPRYVAYGLGAKGLNWLSHTTFKTKETLEDDYGFMDVGEGDSLKVIEYIDKEIDCTVCQGKWVKEPLKHGNDYAPVVVVPVAIRPYIIDEQGFMLEGYGESVYAPNRKEYEQCDKLASIEATHAHFLAKQPLIREYDPTNPSALDPKDVPYYPGAIIDIPKGERFYNLPAADIPRSLELAISRSRARIQRAATADIEYGQLSQQLSGTAISMLKQDTHNLLAPRKKALDNTVTDIAYMLMKQVVTQGLTVPIEIVGNKTVETVNITPDKLDNKCYIKVEYTSEVAWEELEKYQTFEMATRTGAMSRATGRKEILKLPDADKEDNLINLERTEMESPQLTMYKAIATLGLQGRKEEAMTLAAEFRQMLEATQEPPPEEGAGEQLRR